MPILYPRSRDARPVDTLGSVLVERSSQSPSEEAPLAKVLEELKGRAAGGAAAVSTEGSVNLTSSEGAKTKASCCAQVRCGAHHHRVASCAAQCRVQRAECREQSAECRVQRAECRVQRAESRVQSAECRVQSAVQQSNTTQLYGRILTFTSARMYLRIKKGTT
eukprot:1176232-Prorocentrum_minimum.AAC.2